MQQLEWEAQPETLRRVVDLWMRILDQPNRVARWAMRYVPVQVFTHHRVWCDGRIIRDTPSLRLVALHETAEKGMPHTQADTANNRLYICLPLRQQPPSVRTMVHELIHIWQRKEVAFWNGILHKAWGTQSCMYPVIDGIRRINPDTEYAGALAYCGGGVVPVCIFRDAASPKLSDVSVVFVGPGGNRLSPNDTHELGAFFGVYSMDTPEFEHPYETAAYVIADLYDQPNDTGLSRAARALLDAITIDKLSDMIGCVDVRSA